MEFLFHFVWTIVGVSIVFGMLTDTASYDEA